MSDSDVQSCPVCGKVVLPLSTLTQHVEECLVISEMKRETRSKVAVQSKGDSTKPSFFTLMKSASKQDSITGQKSPTNSQKRLVSTLAGKSADVSPPGKKAKIEHSKKVPSSTSSFFQPKKHIAKPTETITIESSTRLSDSDSSKVKSDVSKIPNTDSEKMVTKECLSNRLQGDSKPAQNSIRPVAMSAPSNKGKSNSKDEFIPLAERMRPCGLQDYVGQSKVVGSNSLLRSLLEANEVPSMILWGPPGCGKTSLAHIIANGTKRTSKSRFVTLSATTSGIADVKEVIKVAKNEQQMFKRKTILFMDEIHRFNKSQQDTFLPHVENGTITLIGATTENPSFHLNTALLSRCRVFVLEKLSSEALQDILLRAVKEMGLDVVDEGNGDSVLGLGSESSEIVIERDAITVLSNLCDGDARVALNGLQLAVQSRSAMSKQLQNSKHHNQANGKAEKERHPIRVNVLHVKEGLQRTHLLYDRKGDEHFNIISALHKSMRGSDENASLYWLARMLEGGENPLYIARRLVRFASEDVGLADPVALNQSVAAYQACHFIGMPECEVILAQAAVYLARAPKSIEVYSAYNNAKQCIKDWNGPQPSVPLHIRNAPTKLMKNLGYGSGYKYNPQFDGPVDQTYLPPELENVNFFDQK